MLSGISVVLTRARSSRSFLHEKLLELGAEVILCPCIRFAYVPKEQLEKLFDLKQFTWLVFTSTNAFRSVLPLLEEKRIQAKVAVVGEATRKAVEEFGLEVSLVPEKHTGKELAAKLKEYLGPEDRVLVPQSNKADPTPFIALSSAGLSVECVVTYNTEFESPQAGEGLWQRISEKGIPDAFVFTSPSTVEGFEKVAGLREAKEILSKAAVFSIGPTTTRAIQERGIEVAKEAEPHNEEGLLKALVGYFTERGSER